MKNITFFKKRIIILPLLVACSFSIAHLHNFFQESISKISLEVKNSIENVLIIEFSQIPSLEEFKKIKLLSEVVNIVRVSNLETDYFKKTFELEFKNQTNTQTLISKITSIVQISEFKKRTFAEFQSLYPSKELDNLTNDSYINYQWALKNKGFVTEVEITDLHKAEVRSRKGFDTGWAQIPNINSLFTSKKDIVVAVLDSGLDVNHSELRKQIHTNDIDCSKSGSISLSPKDNDGNGLVGDCMGWDFTKRNKSNAHRTSDKTGHGTHIAGIISSLSNNGSGVSGLSNRIKILPIQVVSGTTRDERSRYYPIVDRMTRAIEYAIERKADVINFSLGWPKIADQKVVRKAVELALSKGITIVAAAGNNSHDAPIFPCSYKGVICVGSYGVSGKISHFSNFGAHVDLVAPGEKILSLIPKSKPSLFFGLERGYDLKTGTSQATPFVTGMVAILKGIYPNISNNQILGRLIYSSWKRDKAFQNKLDLTNKHFLAAAPYLPFLIEPEINSAIIVPEFKESYYHTLTNFKNLTLNIPIRNLSEKSNAKLVQINISSESNDLIFLKSNFEIKNLKASKHLDIQIPIEIKNLWINSEQSYNLTIKVDNQPTRIYKKTLEILSHMDSHLEAHNLPIQGIDKEHSKLKFFNIKTVFKKGAYPEYFYKNLKNKILDISVFIKKGNSYEKNGVLRIDNVSRFFNFLKVDINYDKVDDYLIFYESTTEKNGVRVSTLHYNVYDKNLTPLFGEENSNWILDLEGVFPFQFNWMPITIPSLGKVAMPIGIKNKVSITKADINPDEFDFEINNPQKYRVFYFEPYRNKDGKIHLRTRTLNNYKVDESLNEALGVSFYDSVYVLGNMIPQSLEDFYAHTNHFLIAKAKNNNYFTYYDVQISEKDISLQGINSTYLNDDKKSDIKVFSNKHFDLKLKSILQGENNKFPAHLRVLRPTFNLSRNKFESKDSFAYTIQEKSNIYDIAHINWLKKGNAIHQNKFLSPENSVTIGNYANYVKNDELFSFIITTTSLYLIHNNLNNQTSNTFSKKLIASSFFNDYIFQPNYYPISIKDAGELRPAMYIDSTLLTGDSISIWGAWRDGLKSPVKYNLFVPPHCLSLNPVLWEESHAYVLICDEKTKEKKKVEETATSTKKKVFKIIPLVRD